MNDVLCLRTEAGVDKAVPHAAAPSEQPPSPHTGREAQGRPEHTHQHVTDANVEKQHVNWRPERLKLTEEY